MSNIEKKLVTVESVGTITELGGISGPIINPSFIDVPTIIRMINSHKKVYEVNPNNPSEKVKLSLKNARTNNFIKVAKTSTAANVAPATKTEKKETEAKKVNEETKKETKSDFVKK